MFTVALIGPDGAGKTTIGRRLERLLPVPAKYLYMGINLEASNCMLPTTRLVRRLKQALGSKPDTAGPPDPNKMPKPRGPVRRSLAAIKSLARLPYRMSEEWFRQLVTWQYQWRGYIVIFDRHFFHDYFAYDIAQGGAPKSLARRIHGFALSRLYPQPDLVVYLDAPAEVLFARKGEGTLELLARRRQDYLDLGRHVRHFKVVDATQSVEDVAANVARYIIEFRTPSSEPICPEVS